MIKIRHDIPVPDDVASRSGGIGRSVQFPWREMGVGDSFFAAGYVTKKKRALPGELVMSHQSGQSAVPGSRWTMRECVDDGERGVRVWRRL